MSFGLCLNDRADFFINPLALDRGMRSILLLVVLSILAAGCAANNGTNGGTPTTPTGATPGTNGTAAAKTLKTDDHTFTDTPASPASPVPITVDPAAMTVTINVTFSPAGGAPAGVASGVQVKVGGAVCTLADGPVTDSTTCTKTAPAAGVKQIEYSGAGPVSAHVVVTES